MKPIHILPTDKPSRLFEDDLQLYYSKDKNRIGSIISNKNIYITSDEEIKEVDWFISLEHYIDDFKCDQEIAQRLISKKNKELFEGWINGITISDVIGDKIQGNYQIEYCKKIILTTDQDLIKDGVQVIDDDFLEWFVKNPSCEEVKIESYCKHGDNCPSQGAYDKQYLCDVGYKIIIPQENSKAKEVRSFSREDMKRAFCEGKGIEYDIVISVIEGNEMLDNWLNEFENNL